MGSVVKEKKVEGQERRSVKLVVAWVMERVCVICSTPIWREITGEDTRAWKDGSHCVSYSYV
jgi:hypothetical protein